MDAALSKIFSALYAQTSAVGRSGKTFEMINGIGRNEVDLIDYTIRNDESVLRTLEVGCAIGFSSLAISGALKGRPQAHHTIIDPFQTTGWDGAGVSLLERNGLDNFDLVEQKSEFALPSLLSEGKIFDFILVDGWHTFDHTLIDMFYSLRLLRVGGYLVVDDASWPGVGKAIAYYANIPALSLHSTARPAPSKLNAIFKHDIIRKLLINLWPPKLTQAINLRRFGSMVVLKKTAEDTRNFDWYALF